MAANKIWSSDDNNVCVITTLRFDFQSDLLLWKINQHFLSNQDEELSTALVYEPGYGTHTSCCSSVIRIAGGIAAVKTHVV